MSNQLDILFLLDNCAASVGGAKNIQSNEICSGRSIYGEYHHLLPVLKKYPEKFYQYTRMNINTYEYLLSKVAPKLKRKWCNLHTQPILPEERLLVTIRFLATGASFTNLAFSFRMGVSTVSAIVYETAEIIWNVLYPIHMPVPSKADFLKISEQFYSKWNFPHCIGALDSKHIRIKCPPKSGSKYYNYKKFFSIVLQALVDADYKFIVIDVGGFGQQSDGGTFQASNLYNALRTGKILLPEDCKLPNSYLILPHFFVADGAFPLTDYLMKPYPGLDLPITWEIFNKRLSRARMTVECAFGIMSQKWRIFHSVINLSPEFVSILVKCSCALHNMVIDLEKNEFHQNNIEENRQHIHTFAEENTQNNKCIGYGAEIRQELTKYFMRNPI